MGTRNRERRAIRTVSQEWTAHAAIVGGALSANTCTHHANTASHHGTFMFISVSSRAITAPTQLRRVCPHVGTATRTKRSIVLCSTGGLEICCQASSKLRPPVGGPCHTNVYLARVQHGTRTTKGARPMRRCGGAAAVGSGMGAAC